MNLKLKADSLQTVHKLIYVAIAEGYKVIKEPKKKLFGKWICKLEKK